ncbi:hypothetical protein B2A_11940, partial [mine drainage metagenome]
MSNIQALDDLILVQVDVTASSLAGRAQRGIDYKAENMPPKDILSGGVRHFCDPAVNRIFNTLRKQAEVECARVGISLLKGHAVPRQAAKALDEKLRDIGAKYRTAADELATKINGYYAEWEAKHPEWISVLSRDRPDPASIRAKYEFRHVLYRMRPVTDDLDDPLNEGFGVTHGSLLDAMLNDIAKTSQEL